MRTTKKDFEKFKKVFLSYVDVYGLTDFHFNFVHKEQDNYAQIIGDYNQKAYMVFFSTDFSDLKYIPDGFINYLGFHEATECLLYRLRTLASSRSFDEDEYDSETHGVINRLEKIITNKKIFDFEGVEV